MIISRPAVGEDGGAWFHMLKDDLFQHLPGALSPWALHQKHLVVLPGESNKMFLVKSPRRKYKDINVF